MRVYLDMIIENIEDKTIWFIHVHLTGTIYVHLYMSSGPNLRVRAGWGAKKCRWGVKSHLDEAREACRNISRPI